MARESVHLSVHAQLKQLARCISAAGNEPITIPVEPHYIHAILVAMIRCDLLSSAGIPQLDLHAKLACHRLMSIYMSSQALWLNSQRSFVA